MAGRPKKGIDYSSWSVDIFDSDTKIDKLIDAYGWTGFGIYFYLCQRAYKAEGYFYEWGYDDGASTARKMGGGISSGTVRETVGYCLQIGLFEKRLFDGWGILTSKGIQRRFWTVLSERRVKKVYQEYWLLDDEECKGLVKVALNDVLQPTDIHLQPANDHSLIIKQSKVKNSNIYRPAAYADAFDNQELEDAFQLFISFRNKKGDRLTDEQIALHRQDLIKLSADNNERIEIARMAVKRNWRSLFPLPKRNANTGKKKPSTNFTERDNDYDDIQKQLIAKSMEGSNEKKI